MNERAEPMHEAATTTLFHESNMRVGPSPRLAGLTMERNVQQEFIEVSSPTSRTETSSGFRVGAGRKTGCTI
jgi:hypothetical protein